MASSRTSDTGLSRSLWIETAPTTHYPRLDTSIAVDVAVIGAGIAGITTASMLQRRGAEVALVDAHRIALGASARATVKVSASHGLRASEIAGRFGEDAARTYVSRNAAALETVAGFVDELGTDCSFERRQHVVCAETSSQRQRLAREADLHSRIGLASSLESSTDLPFPVAACLVTENQAQFHPRRYLLGLADAFVDEGGQIYETSPVIDLREDGGWTAVTRAGSVSATDVVLATGSPISDQKFLPEKMQPRMEHAVAAPAPDDAPAEMYLSTGEPGWSIRTADDDGTRLLIVVGEKHPVGEGSEERYQESLVSWMHERFGTDSVRYAWATHDEWTIDGLPFIGALNENLWVATGFGGWGMTNGTAAADILTTAIGGDDVGDAVLFDPSRPSVRRAPDTFLRQSAVVGQRWLMDRVDAYRGAPAPANGSADVGRIGDDLVACYRDTDGSMYMVSAVCTHRGCIVSWNDREQSWDCFCHGSRFAPTGDVISGPANEPLRRIG